MLKEIALSSIKSKMGGEKYLPGVDDPILREKAGVFVTLREFGELRGCIGYIQPLYELWDGTGRAAIHAAISDPRFNPVSGDEIASLEVEVSVLGALEKIEVHDEVDIGLLKLGVEGLVVEARNGSTGLLLPQVAIEGAMDALEFLQATCEKAGLPEGAWKFPGVSVYKFPARVF